MRERLTSITRCGGKLSVILFGFTLASSCVLAQSVQTPLLPTGVAYDAPGNLYFADANRHQVYESTVAGALLVVAGSGVQGFAGDGGSATSALLDSPSAVVVATDGTLYIADTGNQRIRAVSAGKITTYAGNGIAGFSGDNGPATSASLNQPNALALDSSGALLLCDSANQRVRRISAGTIRTVAGDGIQGFAGDGAAATSAELDTPSGVVLQADGSIVIADTGNNRLRIVSASGTISTYAGTGTYGYSGDGAAATKAQLARPLGVTVTSAGLVLFADSNNQRIRMIDAQGNISTIAGSGLQGNSADAAGASLVQIDSPSGMSVSSFGSPVFADSSNKSVRELLSNGNLYLPAGLVPTRSSAAILNVANNTTYGQTAASASVTGSAGTPQGIVQLLNSGSPVAQGQLAGGTTNFPSMALVPGSYSLSAGYEGDGVNPAAMSSTFAVAIAVAPTVTTEQPLAQNSYAGLPLVLTANVTSLTAGNPTGTVQFLDGGSLVATAQLSGNIAMGTYLLPVAGQHSIVANYSGDAYFAPSTSSAVTTTVAATPDFSLASIGSSSQTVQAGSIAVYTFSIAAQPAPFTGAVDMSVSGLPKGAVASFSPPQVVPGTGSVTVILSIQTPAMALLRPTPSLRNIGLWAVLLPMFFWRRRSSRQRSWLAVSLIAMTGFTGCGNRSLSSATQGSASYSMSVSGSGTSLTGSALVHTTPITLTVQ